jgi:hypothetical protein
MKKSLFIIVMSLGPLACSTLDRHPGSGYGQRDTSALESIADYYRLKNNFEWTTAAETLGYTNSDLNETQMQEVVQRMRLKRLEGRLENSLERKQYFTYKPYMATDKERIYFLSLPTREAREVFIQKRMPAGVDNAFDRSTLDLIEKSDVTKGMTRKAVEQSWGEPESKEFAGNPMYGNERWLYSKLVSTQDGYQQETRIIYFEAGRVVGWETRR